MTSAVEPADTAEETAEASGTAEAGRPGEAAAAEGVEIPKQQSAEEAADNEAGEGARK
ncbi:gliding motility protein [Streptomyces sp. CB03234]|uniref:gliding motility protein n=1 Tax=Streptomyces sp. (strain CB03234) TaxID=1703937 RepID=UPI003083C692